MSFKDVWKDKVDGKDDILAKDINMIAHSSIKNAEDIAKTNGNVDKIAEAVKKNASDISGKQDKLSDEQLQNIDKIPDKQNALSQEQLQNINDVPNKASKATTLEGYGITDSFTKKEINDKLGNKADKTSVMEIKNEIDIITNELSVVQSANRFSRSLCNVGYCRLDGTISTNIGYAYMYLDVMPGDVLYFYFLNYYNSDMGETGETIPRELPMRFLCAFDSDGNAMPQNGAENIKTYTVPESVTKIAISIQSTTSNQYGRNIDFVMVLVNDSAYPNGFKPYKTDFYAPNGEDYFKETVIQLNPMHGKIGVCFGDSITMGIGATFNTNYHIETGIRYPDMIAKITKAKIFNVGFGGSRASKTGKTVISFPAVVDAILSGDYAEIQAYAESLTAGGNQDRVYAHLEILQNLDFSKVDFITLAYGTNDWTGNVPVDNAENPLDTSTINGGIRYGIDKILTAYPHLKVFAFTPIYRNDIGDASDDSDTYLYNGKTLKDISDSICECFNSLHIPCKNSYGECNLNKYNMSIYSDGGVHLNNEGYKRLGEQYAEFILSKY